MSNKKEGKLFGFGEGSKSKNADPSLFNDDDIYIDEKIKAEKSSLRDSSAVQAPKTQWEEDEEILSKTVDPKVVETKAKTQKRLGKLMRTEDQATEQQPQLDTAALPPQSFKAQNKASLARQNSDEEGKQRALEKKMQIEKEIEEENKTVKQQAKPEGKTLEITKPASKTFGRNMDEKNAVEGKFSDQKITDIQSISKAVDDTKQINTAPILNSKMNKKFPSLMKKNDINKDDKKETKGQAE